MTVTSMDIGAKLAALDIALSEAEAAFDKHAADAVSGMEGAGSEAAATNARIERLKVEQKILLRAQDRAVRHESEAAAEAEAMVRANHVNAARETALALIEKAELVDRLTDQLALAIADLSRLEAQLRGSLAAARQVPDDGVVGRKGIAGFGLDRLNALASSNLLRMKNSRSTAEVASIGWAYLLKRDDMEIA